MTTIRGRLAWLLQVLICVELAVLPVRAQEAEPTPVPEASTEAIAATTDGLYFADVDVRGRPVFQVGSLADLSAQQRAEIISRRIAGLISGRDTLGQVTVQTDTSRNLATLQLNNRVLMTITQQDAEDYGTSVDALAEDWAERLNRSLDKPPLAIDVVQRLNSTTRQLGRQAVDGIPAFAGALIVIVITWAIARGVRYAAYTWAQQTESDHSTEILIGRLGYGGVWVVGTIVALGVMGLDFAALLGALGLTSVAIGFSLKDVLSNYISGVILLAARPFRLGDQVVIEDYEGTITQIQLRATTLTTYNGSVVYIPNQEVFQASVINHTASQSRRSSVMVGIDYDADITRAVQVILAAIATVEHAQNEPKPDVLVHELAASTVNLEVRFWVNSRRASFLQTTSLVSQAIKEALQKEAIEMPTEIYTLLFRNAPPLPESVTKSAQATLSEAESS
ncbi:MAG: mechanosensitive ion channel family protein [Leptolyngbya sp. SIO4C1]|nr:mechanosensitive ion channel family protein [Leptolyngbya sp. SIO4C1]